jgi:uncharacterized protein
LFGNPRHCAVTYRPAGTTILDTDSSISPLPLAQTPAVSIRVEERLTSVSPHEWDALAGGNPTMSHAYLHALHESGSATRKTGWLPQYLIATRAGVLVGAVPLYLKGHSYGEYVFDWAWAEAHERHGIDYYPKLLAAVPFTPVTGPRILAADAAVRDMLVEALLKLANELHVSSLHVLFPQACDAAALAKAGLMQRYTVQFHWQNAGYSHFDDFLAEMGHDKRKRIRQERRRVADAGVQFTHKVGDAITPQDWDFFYRCYTNTYREHHSTPYLKRDFFARLAAEMRDNILLIVGERNAAPIASSLCIIAPAMAKPTLFGRYWGATEFVSGLHFDACYYQPIEWAIANQIAVFEGGAQGEHKLARGLLPVRTESFHWLRHPAFASAIDDYLSREGEGIRGYINNLDQRSPFRQPPTHEPT